MEAPVNASSAGGDALAAELVVVGGRLSGTRRPLTGPLTLFGQAAGCEVHLSIEGVQPLHAALVHGPNGFLLRDLAGVGDVLVNDQPASTTPLRPGDEIAVGPFRFRLEAAAASVEQAVEAERDALRIQAAAVAAQQTALNEEEMRLNQRRGTLDQQEEQLAARLEERRQRVLELQEQTRQQREEFESVRGASEAELNGVRKTLQAERAAAGAAMKQARADRQRLRELRKRLRRRWRLHWGQQENDLRRREKELSARQSRLEQEAAKVKRAQATLADERLRLSSDAELAQRRLREQGQELALAQQQWETNLNEENAARRRRTAELDARAAALAEAEQVWSQRERSVRLMTAGLHRESAGLEARIRSQREKLAETEAAVAKLQAEHADVNSGTALFATAAPPPVAERIAAGDERTALLDDVADRLTDQRAHLLEQWRRLLQVQDEWRRGREQGLAEMEAGGRALYEREQRVLVQERRLDAATAELRQKQQDLSQMCLFLEGWQARLKARDAAWQTERAALTAEVQVREEAAGLQLQRLEDLTRRREAQRGQEAEELAAARERCEDLRRQYVALWDECRQRRAELAREQRDLAARMLAVEQLRLEVVGKAPHSARAERRMERVQRRNLARLESAEREIDAARKGLAAEGARLNASATHLHRQQTEAAARWEKQAREQTAWENRLAAAEDAEQRRVLELQRLCAQRDRNEHLISQLREEIEHVAGLLMEEAPAPPAAAQAA
ncbi:MAG TPA: FHA domain-containing protein [Gemmataceae bacterium]|nr:FHA domain-containing protein [Gemmataceae bacterium]